MNDDSRLAAAAPDRVALRRLGLIVHPSRPLDVVHQAIAAWAQANGVALGQVPVAGQTRALAEPVDAAECDLLVALGGDGTTLAALHAGAAADVPVLGVACGSVGVLTSVRGDRIGWALDELAGGRSTVADLPALEVSWDDGRRSYAINDLAVLRNGNGQTMVTITVDAVLYAGVAGDGLVVATALGSSAYTLAAGGPLLAPGNDGMVVTPLAPHGGACPPLVAGRDSELALEVEPGYGGVRYEVDGMREPVDRGGTLALRQRADYVRIATFPDEEARLTGLRRRGLVVDSPRVLVRRNRRP